MATTALVKVYVAVLHGAILCAGARRHSSEGLAWMANGEGEITGPAPLLQVLLIPTGAVGALAGALLYVMPFRYGVWLLAFEAALAVHMAW